MIARRILSVIFVLALLGVAPPLVTAADTLSIEELAAQLATTPEQHQAVAAYYRGQAEQARAEAQRHRKMSARYAGGKYVQKKAMEDHCAKLTASYESLAAQYESLAADHDAAAAK